MAKNVYPFRSDNQLIRQICPFRHVIIRVSFPTQQNKLCKLQVKVALSAQKLGNKARMPREQESNLRPSDLVVRVLTRGN